MRRKIFFALLAVTLAAIAANTTAQQPNPPKASVGASPSGMNDAADPQAIVVGASQAGQQINLKRGASLLVRLQANPSTGYSWSVIGDPAPLSFVSSKNETAQQNQPRTGAPGMQVLRFKANVPGTVELTLGYRRPWEKETAPAKTFKIHVTIGDTPAQ